MLTFAGCSGPPLRGDVLAQARPGGRVAFDVVKIDNGVLKTLDARKQPEFAARFAKYEPPPELKIAEGDIVSVVIWESGDNGLFGNSLTELTFRAGASARALTGQLAPPEATIGVPGGLTASSPGMLSRLLGVAPGQPSEMGAAAAAAGAAGWPVPAAEAFAERTQSEAGALAGAAPFGGVSAPPGERRRQAEPGFGAPSPEEEPSRRQLLQLAEKSGRAGTRIPDQLVGSDGAISIPYAGRIRVAGRTPEEVQKTIEALLAAKALDPQVLVVDKRSFANSVAVAGEVVGGKRVPLAPGGERLLQVIAAAGGAHAPVHDVFVRLSRGRVTATVPLAALVADPQEDIFARPGDVLTLVRRPQTFSVFGAAGKNAAITFNSDRLNLAEALAKAGGLLDQRADPRAVFLFRWEPLSLVRALGQPVAAAAHDGLSPVVYRLDLAEAKSYLLARRFLVHDKDVIFVADAGTHPIYNFFSVLSLLTGPIQTGIVTCYYAHC
jgi:polysaccharide biosynthesis/export protein